MNDVPESSVLLAMARSCANLRELRVENSVVDLTGLVGSLPNLQLLVISDCSQLDDSSAIAIAYCQNYSLKKLVLQDLDGLLDDKLVHAVRLCPQLREIHMEEVDSISYSAVRQVVELSSQLQLLKMADCRGLSAWTPNSLGRTQLTSLDVSGCRNSCWDAIWQLAVSSPWLRELRLCRLPHLTADQLAALLPRWSNINNYLKNLRVYIFG
jgi:hypothetical protein